MGPEATRSAQDKAQRLLEENGVTFVAQGDATARPWRLDLFPLLVDPDEWAAIELGVIQRARLLNAAARRSLRRATRAEGQGVCRPGLVFGNPQFLRPCASVGVRDNLHLHFIAFDLARSADGRWWVLSDRTQAPSGAGYALENRVVSSQSLARGIRGAQRAPARELLPLVHAAILEPRQQRSRRSPYSCRRASRRRTISSTRTSRAISASASSKARTSRFATTACT